MGYDRLAQSLATGKGNEVQTGPQPPAGYMGTPEAAELLGVHQQTIRNYVRDGKLEGMKEYDAETKRERYWVKREAVEALIQTQEPQDIEAADQMARRTEDVLQRIATQEHVLNARLDRMEERQQKIAESLESAVEILEDLGDRSRQFQDKMLEMLEEEREYLRRQREELGQEQERGFWGWLFGQR